MVPPAQRNNPFQAARLPFYASKWRQVTNNRFILKVIKEGYIIQFYPHPPPPRPSLPTSHFPSSTSIIRSLIVEYKEKGAIMVIDVRPDQYVSRIFEVPKKSGGYRLIMDLSDLNKYIKKIHFKMDGLSTISSLIGSDDFMASLDLQDAFLTIAMHPSMYKYLCFDFEGVRYCFVALVFGLSCAPRIFTKLLKIPLSYLRLTGHKNSAWLDDILLVGSSYSSTKKAIKFAYTLLESLGFVIKDAKSQLLPTQSISHVGFEWDSVAHTVSVPSSKVTDLKLLCMNAKSRSVSLRFLAKIIGTIESFIFGCPIAPLHYRHLQFDLNKSVSKGAHWNTRIELSAMAIGDLDWWLGCELHLPPSPLAPFSHTHTMETDASLEGWGAYSGPSHFTQGRWSLEESKLHINYLELKAVLLGLKALFPKSNQTSILVLSDNIPAVRYINHKGGTRSRDLCLLALSLWEHCNNNNIVIKAVYYRGLDNVRADKLSREFIDNHDYHLSPKTFSILHTRLNLNLTIDLFASRLHHLLPTYASRLPDPGSSFVDAFSIKWSNAVYLFPPIVLLDRVMKKFVADKCPLALLIAPYRPTSPYFSNILDLCVSQPIVLPDSAVFKEARHCKVSPMWAWTISCDLSLRKDYLRTLSTASSKTWKDLLSKSTSTTGQSSVAGVTEGKLIVATLL